ncbi:right-handed parallel beta-helix repeat-containing protein [Kushneria sp. EE4]
MSKQYLLLMACMAELFPVGAQASSAETPVIWQSITFGQSTDLNFGSTILPEKVGTNATTRDGEQVKPGPFAGPVVIESRGGKLANSHEGVTYYYTTVPAGQNFVLAATLTLEQLGPETGATPNRQEGAGIMARDILGPPRAEPQPLGHEEFPAASNMVMNLLRSHSRDNDGMANATAVYRAGILEPWGSPGNRIDRTDYVEGIEHGSSAHYRMTLERDNEGFQITLDDGSHSDTHRLTDAPADLVERLDPEHQYIGFFASRNARLRVEEVTFNSSPAAPADVSDEAPPEPALVWEIASPEHTGVRDYPLQARSGHTGEYQVWQNGKALGEAQSVEAGALFQQMLTIDEPATLELRFTPRESADTDVQTRSLTVTPVAVADPMNLYVAPEGNTDADGSREHPLDLTSAIERVAPGGTIQLTEGDYSGLELPLSVSGTSEHPKRLTGEGARVRITDTVSVDAAFWQLDHLEVAGARFLVQGSDNRFEFITVHDAPDTGFQISSPEGLPRTLWASRNVVRYSESFNNRDASEINADGFAAKMRVGDGNTFDHCLSHHNIDDGWDLFNKIEDGPNGVVTITNSIAFANGAVFGQEMSGSNRGNGFKLGGEGLPVAHVVRGNLSFNNRMDGFTDNFNPGALTLERNIALDNHRFNFIVRQSPYEDRIEPARLDGNRSLRLLQESAYEDSVHGDISARNWFIADEGHGPADTPVMDDATQKAVTALLEKTVSTPQEARERAETLRTLLADQLAE